jgi:hypothetical protein
VAGWVEEDFRAYLRCGILAHGFARVHGSDREKRRAVASRYRNAPNEGLQWTCGIILLPQTREVIMVLFRPEATPGDGAPELEIRVHYDPDLRPEDVTTVDGIPVTTPARTLLDLATCVDDDELEQALVNALQRGLTTYAEIREVMARYPRHDGLTRLGALLEQATGS